MFRDGDEAAPQMDEKVLAVYKGVANILKRYTTGRLPKAFKIIPTLRNWEEVSLLAMRFTTIHYYDPLFVAIRAS